MHEHRRQSVADIRAMKAAGRKLSMLYVSTLEEARFFSAAMREAAGACFVQVGLPYGPAGNLVTADDYLREAFRYLGMGGDCVYCAASFDIRKTLCDNAVPVIAHVGLIPSQCTWTGGFSAVGKTASCARQVWEHVKRAAGGDRLFRCRAGGGSRSGGRAHLEEYVPYHAGYGGWGGR